MNEPQLPEDTPDEFPAGYDEVRVHVADPTEEPPSNRDGNGVHHYCVIPPRGGEYCGGCQKDWPCPDAVRLLVLPIPTEE